MSLKLVNHKETTAENIDGVIIWSNPKLDVTFNSKGEVFRRGVKLQNTNLQYCIKIKESKYHEVRNNVSFNSLYAYCVLGESLLKNTLKLKDPTLGYVDGNVEILPAACKYNRITQTVVQEPSKTIEEVSVQPTEQYFTKYEAKNEHITEDGAVFPTRELAEWHQNNVSKGKGNAQIVLDYNGGYVLAEQIFLQEVKYNKKQPYLNFVDVMNNNKGIISDVYDECYVFDELGKLSRITNIGLGGIINLVVKTETQALNIQKELENYVKAEETYNSSVLKLKDLLEQVK